MTNTKGIRPPIWEASRRPMFVKSVWLDNQGYRHIILDGVTTKKRANCPTVQRVLRKHLTGSVRGGHQDVGGRPGGKPGEESGSSGGNLRDSEVIVISEQSKNQLTERVLQWLDLAGKNTLVRPESEVASKDTSAGGVTQRRIFTAEVNRKLPNQGLPCLKRTESVHHLSITLNEEDSGEASRSDTSGQTPRIKFGDFFPVTYRCSRKFLSHSSYRNRLNSPPTYMNTPMAQSAGRGKVAAGVGSNGRKTLPEHANRNDKNRKQQFSSAVTSSSTGGKLGKNDSIENQYRGIIHRQLLETSCNTQIAKRQLHIFMPNLPNKTKGDCDSCLSSDLSKKSHNQCLLPALKISSIFSPLPLTWYERFVTSRAWKRDLSGGSNGAPRYFGTGNPRAITRKSSDTLTRPHRVNSSVPYCSRISEEHIRHCMLFYFRRKISAEETTRDLCNIYGEDTVKEETCKKWFRKFEKGDFSLDKAPK
uniref:Mos1 transposase HTH domain-containing protein n=1 Tax=Phlebotomus papatasi TaxID=29031 RepID=A0A1B0GMB2_PHLPP